MGSGNPGATNVWRLCGPLAALAVLTLDLAKGWLPVAVGARLSAPQAALALAAVAAVLGHAYPLFLGLRGGKGVATAFGALAGLAPVPVLAAALVLAVLVVWKRYVSLGSIIAVPLIAVLMLVPGLAAPGAGAGAAAVSAAAAVALLVVVRHLDNIRRLRDGTESRLGEPAELRRA